MIDNCTDPIHHWSCNGDFRWKTCNCGQRTFKNHNPPDVASVDVSSLSDSELAKVNQVSKLRFQSTQQTDC